MRLDKEKLKLCYIKFAFKLFNLEHKKKVDSFDRIQTFSHLRVLGLYNMQLNRWQRARAIAHRDKRIRVACAKIKAIFQLTKATRLVNFDSLKLGINQIKLHSYLNKGYSQEHAGVALLSQFFRRKAKQIRREPFDLIRLKFTGKVTASERIINNLEPKKPKSLFGSIQKRFNKDKYIISKKISPMNEGIKSTDDEDISEFKRAAATLIENAAPKIVRRI